MCVLPQEDRELDVVLYNPILFLFASYTIGFVGDLALRRWSDYERISNMRFFSRMKTYERIGIRDFGWVVRRFRLNMNHGLKDGITGRDADSLKAIRDHMTGAEIGHWIGALVLVCVTIVAAVHTRNVFVVLGYLFLNLFGNVYLSLLQQYNKWRLDRAIHLASRSNRRLQGQDGGAVAAKR